MESAALLTALLAVLVILVLIARARGTSDSFLASFSASSLSAGSLTMWGAHGSGGSGVRNPRAEGTNSDLLGEAVLAPEKARVDAMRAAGLYGERSGLYPGASFAPPEGLRPADGLPARWDLPDTTTVWREAGAPDGSFPAPEGNSGGPVADVPAVVDDRVDHYVPAAKFARPAAGCPILSTFLPGHRDFVGATSFNDKIRS